MEIWGIRIIVIVLIALILFGSSFKKLKTNLPGTGGISRHLITSILVLGVASYFLGFFWGIAFGAAYYWLEIKPWILIVAGFVLFGYQKWDGSFISFAREKAPQAHASWPATVSWSGYVVLQPGDSVFVGLSCYKSMTRVYSPKNECLEFSNQAGRKWTDCPGKKTTGWESVTSDKYIVTNPISNTGPVTYEWKKVK